MKIVICEKNISAKRIANILADGRLLNKRIGTVPIYEFKKDNDIWKVIGLKGHIVDLDFPPDFNQWNSIPPAQLIDIQPVKKISERAIASALKSLVITNPSVIIATDYDREGELIGVEAIELIKEVNKNINDIKRARFSAITDYEVKKAFENLVQVDYNLASAGEARQIIDLIWGATLTRFISLTTHRFGKDFLSIGRVQSPTLALLVEREKEIRNFVPKPYWKIIAELKKDKTFEAIHIEGQIWDNKKAKEIFEKVRYSKNATVLNVNKKLIHETPPPPFNTTSFLEACSYLGLSSFRAMSIAEELYMYGLISYPRTDNTVYPSSLNIRGILNKLLHSKFSKEAKEVLENGRAKPTRGSKYATDHPPIHPVDVIKDQKLTRDHEIVYELVCRRFLATLAKDALSESIEATFDINGEVFRSEGYRIIEPGWRSIYIYLKEKEKPLPELFEKDKVDVVKVILNEEKTKPPPRYTQGTLIQKMEQLSLGTKSTRHEIIKKLYERKYITLSPLAPTPTAFAVIEALGDCEVVKPRMTARLEKDMDAISEGKKTLDEIIEESRNMLRAALSELEKNKEEIKTRVRKAEREENTVGNCPICGKPMVIRKSKKNKRFVGCTGYPDCKNTYSLPQDGRIIVSNKRCSKCNAPVIKIKSKNKRAWELCLNPNCSAKKPFKKKSD